MICILHICETTCYSLSPTFCCCCCFILNILWQIILYSSTSCYYRILIVSQVLGQPVATRVSGTFIWYIYYTVYSAALFYNYRYLIHLYLYISLCRESYFLSTALLFPCLYLALIISCLSTPLSVLSVYTQGQDCCGHGDSCLPHRCVVNMGCYLS